MCRSKWRAMFINAVRFRNVSWICKTTQAPVTCGTWSKPAAEQTASVIHLWSFCCTVGINRSTQEFLEMPSRRSFSLTQSLQWMAKRFSHFFFFMRHQKTKLFDQYSQWYYCVLYAGLITFPFPCALMESNSIIHETVKHYSTNYIIK